MVDFDKKVGQMITEGLTYELYDTDGFISAYKDDVIKALDNYVLHTPTYIIVNEEHMRNMLGLTPGYRNCMKNKVDRLILYKQQCRNWKRIVEVFGEGLPELKIELIDC